MLLLWEKQLHIYISLCYFQEYNKHCIVDSSFQLDPHQVKSFSFSFPASQSSVRDTIEVRVQNKMYV